MVGPIDAKVSILQTHPTEKVQQVQQQHADMQQRYFNLQLTEERRLQKEKVKDLEQKDSAVIRDTFEREQKRQEAKDQGKEERDGESPASGDQGEEEPVPGSHIDIKA